MFGQQKVYLKTFLFGTWLVLFMMVNSSYMETLGGVGGRDLVWGLPLCPFSTDQIFLNFLTPD